jgi:hypothetical protein
MVLRDAKGVITAAKRRRVQAGKGGNGRDQPHRVWVMIVLAMRIEQVLLLLLLQLNLERWDADVNTALVQAAQTCADTEVAIVHCAPGVVAVVLEIGPVGAGEDEKRHALPADRLPCHWAQHDLLRRVGQRTGRAFRWACRVWGQERKVCHEMDFWRQNE